MRCQHGNAGQVMARVDDSEVSLLQFRQAVSRLGVTNPSPAVRREVAEKLVDRELAVRQALASNLDRQPDVLTQLEEARRDVLARAYAERIAAAAEKPTENDAARYYAEHPELFQQRRIYRLQEAALPADLPHLTQAKARFEQGQSLAQVIQWLRQEKAAINEQTVIRAAEQLLIEALPRMNAASEGQTLFFESPRGVIAYRILSAQAAPISWEAARPIIRDHLYRQAGKQVVMADLQRLRSRSSIAYFGEFAQIVEAAADKRAATP